MNVEDKQEAYSPFKVAHHMEKINKLRAGIQPVPAQVQLVISDVCNHDCSFCAYRMTGYTSNEQFGEYDEKKGSINNNPNRKIPFEKCLEILEDFAEIGVKAVQFTGGGEPTTHPDHELIFQKAIDLGLDLALVTNGTILKPSTIKTLVKSKWIRFSLDAATAETYSNVRKVNLDSFSNTLRNIKKLVDARNENKSSELIIGVGFVVDQSNYTELYESAKIISGLGVDNMRISAAFTPDDFEYHEGLYTKAQDQVRRIKEDFQNKNFRIFDVFGERIDDLIHQSPDYDFCGYMHFNAYIGGDLNIYSCCNNAYSKYGNMGSITDVSFKEFWFSDKKIAAYGSLKASSCKRCMFNTKNKFISYLMLKDPLHVNFV